MIIAANRDEFYDRKTAAASFWEDHPRVLAGRDLQAMGTWMGITTKGKISLLTNYRDPKNIDPAAPSRGQLVSDYLISDDDPETYLRGVAPGSKRYNGYNLLAGSVDEMWYYSNYREGITYLEAGVYGLSNHLLDTPWPKVVRGKAKIQPLMEQPAIDPEELFSILYDEEVALDDQLPDTGLPLERERALSSMFIKTSNYGSRCSTVVLADYDNNIVFEERVYDIHTFEYKVQRYQFSIK